MKMKLAFYKGKGNYLDKLIRIWTRSKYSHVELVYEDKWYSSSHRDNGVRVMSMENPNDENWEYVEVDVDPDRLGAVYIKHAGNGYDWLGILFSELMPLNMQSNNKCYCSEFCSEVLQLEKANISPKKLYEIVIRR